MNAILNTPHPKRQSKHETGLIFPSSGAMQPIAIIQCRQFPSVHWEATQAARMFLLLYPEIQTEIRV